MTARPMHLALSALLFAATVGPAAAQSSGTTGKKSEIARIRIAEPDTQIFQVFIDRKPMIVLYRKGNEVGLEVTADGDGLGCRHDVAVVTSDGRLADLQGVNFCETDWVVTIDAASLSGGSGAKSPPASAATSPAAASAGDDCGWLAIMACQRDSAAAERDSTRIMGGVSVISTDDYRDLDPGLYCAAQGPYATEAEAEQTAGFFRGKGAPDAYTRQACEASATPATEEASAEPAEPEPEPAPPPARDLELAPGWNFVPRESDYPATLAYADASTGGLQFMAACNGADEIAVTLYRVPEGATAGSEVDTALATSAFRQRYRATVSGDGGSVVLSADPRDPLWRALAAHARLDIATGTLGAYRLSLRGSAAAVRPFIADCEQAPSASGAQPEATAAPSGTARYACDRGPRLEVFYDKARNRAVVSAQGGEPLVLDHVPSESGALYRAGGYELHSKGREVVWAQPGGSPFTCRGE